jgi:transposase-like protein
MPKLAQIKSLPEAFAIIKQMNLRPKELSADMREDARRALTEVINGRMCRFIDSYLEGMEELDVEDRRNGGYDRHLLTELGDLVLNVPRTRTTSAAWLLRKYARRTEQLDRTILAAFLFGVSTRKVAKALLPLLGERFSPTLVSNVSKSLDTAVAAFHRRRLVNRYRALLFDGVVLSRRTGAGAVRRPVLVALGLLRDGKKEVIDFRVAISESEREWEVFLNDLQRRGLTEEGLEVITVDGGKGLHAALVTVFPGVPIQRCWAHKARNLTDHARVPDHNRMKRDIRRIYNAKNQAAARQAAHRFAEYWQRVYPQVVRSLREDLEELLTCFRFKEPEWRKAVRTTNAIERRFLEVRRRTRPMGVMADRSSMERILFAVFNQENQQEGVGTLFLLTHNN